MRIAILGTGNVGTTLTDALVAAGHDVTIGSRHPNDHTDTSAPVTDPGDAAAGAEVVINALPGGAAMDALVGIAQELDSKIILDLANAVDEKLQLLYPNSSFAEHLQHALPDSMVVKTLNTFSAAIMVNPGQLPEASSVFLSGDDADAKATVARILIDLGWPTETHVDLGGIATASGPEAYFSFFFALMQKFGDDKFNLKVIR